MTKSAGRGGAVGDYDVAVRGYFGKCFFEVEAPVEAAAIAPDEDGEGGVGKSTRAVDGVLCEVTGGGVGCLVLRRSIRSLQRYEGLLLGRWWR